MKVAKGLARAERAATEATGGDAGTSNPHRKTEWSIFDQ